MPLMCHGIIGTHVSIKCCADTSSRCRDISQISGNFVPLAVVHDVKASRIHPVWIMNVCQNLMAI